MNKFRAYLELVRLPAVFTAMADIFLGFVLAGNTFRGFNTDRALGLIALLIASSCLYCSGMVFNDIFDRHVDAAERPQRPLPSGRISRAAAVRLGILLVVMGIAAAAISGVQSLLVASVLTVFILLYDGLLKRTPLGPVAMGVCRMLNVLLGASFLAPEAVFTIHISWTELRMPILARPQLPVAAALGTYVAGVTWFARREAQQSSRVHLAGATAVINLGLGGLIVLIFGLPGLLLPWRSPGETDGRGVVMALVIIALILNRRLVAAILNPVPGKVQPAVRTLLLSIIMLDAILVFFHTNSPGYAVATAVLIVPAMVLGRWVFVT